MAKKTKDVAPKPRTNGVPEGIVIPQGYEAQSGDLVGFWDYERAPSIHFVPLEAKAFDSNIDPLKPSMLVIGKLVEPCTLVTAGEHEELEGKAGDMIGVWWKAGMIGLKDLCGVKVFMYPNGEKETGKPNPMVVFEIHAPRKGTKLLVTDDKRDKSRYATTVLMGPKGNAKENASVPPEQGDDDTPF